MPAAVSLESRLRALSSRPCLRVKTFGVVRFDDDLYPLSAISWGDPSLPGIAVVAGIHGDEPEGVEAAFQIFEGLPAASPSLRHHHLIVFPCLNPSGLAMGTRANRAAQDINRQFHADTTPETTALRHFCKRRRLRALVDLHTDSRAENLYVIELPQFSAPALGPALRDALIRRGCPLESRPDYGGFPGRDGLIAPTPEEVATFGRRAHGMALAEWGWQGKVANCFVVETPAARGLTAGAAQHRLALDALFEVLEANAEVKEE